MRRRRACGFLPLAFLVTLVILPSQALASPPNDAIENATVIGQLPFTDRADTRTSTPDDVGCWGGGDSVWYSFTPSSNLTIEADTLGSHSDHSLCALTEIDGSLSPVAVGDSNGGVSRMFLSLEAGKTYYFELLFQGDLVFSVWDYSHPASNDEFAQATPIGDLGFRDGVSVGGATSSATDPACLGAPSNTVWYSYVAGATDRIYLTTFRSTYQADFCAYTGSPGSFVQVGSSAEQATRTVQEMHLDVVRGTTYYFLVGTQEGADFLNLLVEKSFDVDVDVDRTATVDDAGTVTLSGTAKCDFWGHAGGFGGLTQSVGRGQANGDVFPEFVCPEGGGPARWTALLSSYEETAFSPGAADLGLNFGGCWAVDLNCSLSRSDKRIALRPAK